MTDQLFLETRDMKIEGRNVVGRCVPYNETSYLVPSPNGERIQRGAFKESIAQRGLNIFLNLEHDERRTVAKAVRWDDGEDGLVGEFHFRNAEETDRTLEELRDGWWPFMSVAFRPLRQGRGSDGAVEVRTAKLAHVALVKCPAYDGAEVLAVRHESDPHRVLEAFGSRPDIDLTPIPRFW
ncbi:MAG: HK97 family phage prohead protease [Actinobacteria bacterium]|nr:HK97 family phage prohead protease [Actinomycetota bacterium]